MTPPEFSRVVKADQLGHGREAKAIAADEAECAALAKRFDLVAVSAVSAAVDLWCEGSEVRLEGRMSADVVQRCVVTGAPVPVQLDEPLAIRFAVPVEGLGEEIELDADECDVMDYDGQSIDVGEAVAQSLALSLNPFPRAPDAETALKAAGVVGEREVGAFGALAALRDQLTR